MPDSTYGHAQLKNGRPVLIAYRGKSLDRVMLYDAYDPRTLAFVTGVNERALTFGGCSDSSHPREECAVLRPANLSPAAVTG